MLCSSPPPVINDTFSVINLHYKIECTLFTYQSKCHRLRRSILDIGHFICLWAESQVNSQKKKIFWETKNESITWWTTPQPPGKICYHLRLFGFQVCAILRALCSMEVSDGAATKHQPQPSHCYNLNNVFRFFIHSYRNGIMGHGQTDQPTWQGENYWFY